MFSPVCCIFDTTCVLHELHSRATFVNHYGPLTKIFGWRSGGGVGARPIKSALPFEAPTRESASRVDRGGVNYFNRFSRRSASGPRRRFTVVQDAAVGGLNPLTPANFPEVVAARKRERLTPRAGRASLSARRSAHSFAHVGFSACTISP
jgi:hypothetical protein